METKPQRDQAIAERIKALTLQRELIDAELEMLQPHHGGQRVASPQPSEFLPKWKYSLVGFHNPMKHRGLTPKQFIEAYKKRKKHSPDPNHQQYFRTVVANEAEALAFVAKRFPHTLKSTVVSDRDS